ncbi:hypothetical protein [Marinilabilia sp.]|uniref:hypothetical protein n=1 Tax=Marinilabilia sp. TaxID=2021252 RepID=UPI0025C1E9F5|nr:hypothetical protein [Marinilabilia sp.]
MKRNVFFILTFALMLFTGCGSQGADKSNNPGGISDVEEISDEAADSISAKIEETRTELDQKVEEVDAALEKIE